MLLSSCVFWHGSNMDGYSWGSQENHLRLLSYQIQCLDHGPKQSLNSFSDSILDKVMSSLKQDLKAEREWQIQ